jgi:hypothetical protein
MLHVAGALNLEAGTIRSSHLIWVGLARDPRPQTPTRVVAADKRDNDPSRCLHDSDSDFINSFRLIHVTINTYLKRFVHQTPNRHHGCQPVKTVRYCC